MKYFAKVVLFFLIAAAGFVLLRYFNWFTPKEPLDFSGEKTVTVSDNGLEHKMTTKAPDVGAALTENNIQTGEKDEIIPPRETAVFPGMNIIINRQARVKIYADGKVLEKTTLTKTVSAALAESDIALGHADEADPHPETRLSDGLEIKITRVNTEEITEEEPIDFETVEKKDKQVDWGLKKITKEGEKGVREVSYKITYKNGKETKRVKLASKITKKPVAEVVSIGTRLNIGKSKTGIASWYNADLDECASRDHPPGTWLRVTSIANGKQVFVRVAGYGPQEGTGKLIDLDNKSFKQIASLGQGVVRVKVEEILNKNFKP
ncbi:MAG: DUF348 domain-containing protein [Candidatus Moranbacteria bacterium]|nr:DUF348 domain-containing protein [Candidatus Moranbacteria bacterium]